MSFADPKLGTPPRQEMIDDEKVARTLTSRLAAFCYHSFAYASSRPEAQNGNSD